jgi:hypothetical protein
MGAGTFNQPTAGYQQQTATGTSGLAVAALVTGIFAMLTFWVWGAIVLSPMAIAFGIVGRKQTRGTPRDGEGMATAGLILGVVAIVLTVPWGIIVASS